MDRVQLPQARATSRRQFAFLIIYRSFCLDGIYWVINFIYFFGTAMFSVVYYTMVKNATYLYFILNNIR